MAEYDVVVVGGGHNGLTAAVKLALHGARVAVVEATTRLGGLAANYSPWPGFKAPLGAYVLGLYPRRLMEELGVAGRVRLIPKEPGMTVLLGGGRALRIYPDEGRTSREIGRFSEADARAYGEWSRIWRLAGLLLEAVYTHPPASLSDVIDALERVRRLPLVGDRVLRVVENTLWAIQAPASRLLSEFFESEEVRAALVEDAIVGELASPSTPGTSLILAHHYLGSSTGRRGEWAYVEGGMGRLSEVLAERLRELGGRIYTGLRVRRVVSRGGRAYGVELDDGRVVEARRGVILATSVKIMPSLLGDSMPERDVRRVRGLESRGASAKVILALKGGPPRPSRSYQWLKGDLYRSSVVVMPSLDYAERALADALREGMSREPWLSVNVLTDVDPSLAPEGWSLTSIYLQYAVGGSGWGVEKRRLLLDRVKGVLGDYFSIDWGEAKVDVITPGDYEALGVPGGHIFHISMRPDQLYANRPLPGVGYKLPWLEGLYIASASAHPGGGVTGLPGLLAAEALLADAGVVKPRRLNIASLAERAVRGII